MSAIDLATCTPAESKAFSAGYRAGYVHGVERGREQMDDELAAIQRRAVGVVHGLAKVPAVRPGDVTAPSDQLTANAEERRQESIRRFRADHARRRAELPGGEGR